MRVVLKDRTEILVTPEQAEKLKDLLLDNDDGFVDINNQVMRKSRIVEIRSDGLKLDDVPQFDQIESGQKCHGQYSIQNEINQIAKNEHPKEWSKLIRDPKWRNETYKHLKALSSEWCDYKTNQCYCEEMV